MQYRRVTRACARRDWAPAETHDEVVGGNGGNSVLKRFFEAESLDYCYTLKNRMDRSRDCKSPGPHIIGNFHLKALWTP